MSLGEDEQGWNPEEHQEVKGLERSQQESLRKSNHRRQEEKQDSGK